VNNPHWLNTSVQNTTGHLALSLPVGRLPRRPGTGPPPRRRRDQGPQPASEPAPASAGEPALLEVCDLRVHFPIARGTVFRRTVGHVHAVDGISLGLAAAETVGLVGESGSGKTTLGRAATRSPRWCCGTCSSSRPRSGPCAGTLRSCGPFM
jgi:ABC-type glutathione transport system ATPase component